MGESARILVVDDNESVRKILKTVLEYVGYVVDTAKTGEEALKLAKLRRPNIALVDYSLIDMEFTDFLKKFCRVTPSTQIIVVADRPSLRKVTEMVGRVSRKPYPYLLKPFDMESALTIIKEQLRKHQWRRRSGKIAVEFAKPLERRL